MRKLRICGGILLNLQLNTGLRSCEETSRVEKEPLKEGDGITPRAHREPETVRVPISRSGKTPNRTSKGSPEGVSLGSGTIPAVG